MMTIIETIASVVERNNLEENEAYESMRSIMSGQVSDAQIAGLITALHMKGETGEEITGFARAIREKALKVNSLPGVLVDTCGTGGDMSGTFNISTTAAFVVAACGLPVAKHGNRSVSSKSGSADVLEKLGININLSPAGVTECINQTGIGFLFAPAHHQAMKYAARARKEVGIRTVFNLLGPLVNPAGAVVQIMGVYDPALTRPLAEVLVRLGAKAAMVVHGAGGLDEISTLGLTRITEIRAGKSETYDFDPAKFGIAEAVSEDLRGGDPGENAVILRRILQGEPGPKQDVVVLNAAAALYAGGKAQGFGEAIIQAREAICSGEALSKLELMREFTNRFDGEGAGADKQSTTA